MCDAVGERARVLYIGPDEATAEANAAAIAETDATVSVRSSTPHDAYLDYIDAEDVECVVSAYHLGGTDGVVVLRAVRERFPDLPFVLVAADGSEAVASEAIAAGVTEYYPVDGGLPAALPDRLVRAAETYRERRERRIERRVFDRVAELNDISTVVVDGDGDVVFADRRAADVLDVGDRYTVGTYDVYDADGEFVPVEERPYMSTFETGETLEGWECRIELPDGDRWVSISAAPLDADGDAERVVVTAEDVTGRRAREQRLQTEKERFQRLVNEVKDYAIFGLDPGGHVTSWNEGARRIKGYDTEEILGEHFSTFYTDDAVADGVPERNLRAARERGRTEDVGWRVRQDGTRFWANVVITALHDDDGTLQGFSKVTRDMTERHEYEQQLEHERERLEFVNRLLRHNLLNSLNVVSARVRMAESHVAPEGREHVDIVRERVDGMIDLIETLRSLMRVLVEDDDREFDAVRIDTVLTDEVTAARSNYPDADFRFVDEPPSVAVRADELLPEVFENLLENAVRHNDAATPRVDVGVAVGDETVTVRIADNGPGVPDELEAALFEKGTKSFESPGTGFGLYLVSEIVASYGGDIAVESGDDGAVFEVRLPRPE